MTNFEPAPQTVTVNPAERWMERPIEVAVTEHPNERHSNATKVWLTRDSAWELVRVLSDYLSKESEPMTDHPAPNPNQPDDSDYAAFMKWLNDRADQIEKGGDRG